MNPSTAQASAVVDELVRGGVRDVVLCPGSRNAPLAFALHAAEVAGRIRMHVRIDERTAGFLAIGLSLGSGLPVPVVMTSGTAVANLTPAVFEANYARVPMIVLSANRPYEMLGTGANQTVEQLGMFNEQVRACISLGIAEEDRDQNSQWRSAVCRVLAAARGDRTGNAGPVQFDLPLREPLVPEIDGGEAPPGRPGGAPWTSTPRALLDVPLPIDVSLDTIVVAGHGSGEHPELEGLPTVTEPTARHVPGGIEVHPYALGELHPQQAIITGRPTLHRSVSRLLADPRVAVHALTTGPRWPDISGNLTAAGTRAVLSGTPRHAFLEQCRELSERARVAMRRELANHPKPTGLHVADAIIGAARPGDLLVVGASNPVRDVALAGPVPEHVRVVSNRGVAGIDGTVSTAVGAALSHGGRAIALLGDLTFLHDSSGLLLGPHEPRPEDLTIVVANDDGGGIFELLEQGDPVYAGAFERIFGTPHGVNAKALCEAYNIPYQQPELEQLGAVLAEGAAEAGGVRIVEVRTDRSGLRELHSAIRATVAR
ncbi:2-succinyl-5-enolpyruvyl-6-hydroxy-3-cyclohexene-1-carboxylic-acid synthase [Lolliginicoccus suaedae]|uniref:2-succinyl-5-enolpyruvyl-6-hydroxy-3- cyclohexene-1-carboxylic-acid synthase n=1 Tax=Lolliginicoccus suaedae TaxID=2605429 RepID=UPI0011EE9B26|nr:2-succinyl-5-enolpyruvyl-6-hydroxy-3-cyclohexene-1-carboxylic-acid synthase [Lolliginicoccus suaedae]